MRDGRGKLRQLLRDDAITSQSAFHLRTYLADEIEWCRDRLEKSSDGADVIRGEIAALRRLLSNLEPPQATTGAAARSEPAAGYP